MPEPLTEGYIETRETTLHYWRSGGAGPPIVLSHGFSDNGLCWSSMITALAGEYDVIAFDARAHGHSFAPEGAWTIDDQASDLVALVDRLALEKPVLMGHSMGGLATFWAAIEHPDLPGALIFEDSAIPRGEVPTADTSRTMRDGMRDWAASLQARSVDELVALCRENSPLWPEEDYRPWAESKLQLDLEAIAQFSMYTDRDLADFLPKLDAPALFLMADAAEEERARQRELVSAVPNARVEHVPEAGHNVRRDQQAATLRLMREFLGSIPG